MLRLVSVSFRLQAFLLLAIPTTLLAQSNPGRIVSEHVRMKIPVEREWLGRDTIVELERCYQYVNGVTGKKLPDKVLIEVISEALETTTDFQGKSVSIGMGHAMAAPNMKSFLLHNAARELARLGLAEISREGTLREDGQFLGEGMAEIIAHEYDRSTRALTSTWVLCHFLDRMALLGLAAQSSWSAFSAGRRDLRAAAPGATFLMTCREIYGRERTSKLFEALKKGSLSEAIAATFRSSAAAVEDAWLRKVRGYQLPEDVTVTSEEDAPVLRQTVFLPPAGRPGMNLQMQLHIRDAGNDLFPSSVFVVDEASGLVIAGREPAKREANFTLLEIPIATNRRPGRYGYRATAVDEAGNVRHWKGFYIVEP